ncbi:hypothetical protein [Pandoraea oxalativorans]|uniref:hypothetical protein n=1 Tax=Pandoraea oxalativorans TaxID=573737 RepID=UPI000A5B3326|nr:hypothetical protein [Pandoraea oxalativorans]
MPVLLSRDTDDLRVQLSSMPSDTKIGINKCGVVVQYGGFDYHLHPQQSVRACNFILNREISPKRMPSAWTRFAAQIRAVFSGVKASRLLRVLNSRAVQSVGRLSVRSGVGGSTQRTPNSSLPIHPFKVEGPANDDRLINDAQTKLAAFRARNALKHPAVTNADTLAMGSVGRNTHDAATASSLSQRLPAQPSIGVPPPNLVPPKPPAPGACSGA